MSPSVVPSGLHEAEGRCERILIRSPVWISPNHSEALASRRLKASALQGNGNDWLNYQKEIFETTTPMPSPHCN